MLSVNRDFVEFDVGPFVFPVLRRGGLKTAKVSFGGGRIREIMCFLRISKDGRL